MRAIHKFVYLGLFLTAVALTGQDSYGTLHHLPDELQPLNIRRYGTGRLEKRQVLAKRDNNDSIASIIGTLKAKLTELGLTRLIHPSYFETLLEEGQEKEFQARIGVVRRICKRLNFRIPVSMAYKGKKGAQGTPASRKPGGEDQAFIKSHSDSTTFLGVISGNSDWLPPGRDSTKTCEALQHMAGKIYDRSLSRIAVTAKEFFTSAWASMQNEVVEPGCVSATFALVLPDRKISVSNLGNGWAGLYRNGRLLHASSRSAHEDGSPFQLCIPHPNHAPRYFDEASDSRAWTWNSEIGDVFVMVSRGIRDVLSPREIFTAFRQIQKIEPQLAHNEDFDLVSMGIVKAAQIASGGVQRNDMTALVLAIV